MATEQAGVVDRDSGPVVRRLPLTAAALRVGDTVHQHTSVRGEVAPDLHPVVRRFLHDLPVESTERYAGWCAEVVLVSDRLYAAERSQGAGLGTAAARELLWGAQVSVCLVREPGDPMHGRPVAPCRTCAALLEWLGIDSLAPDSEDADSEDADPGDADPGDTVDPRSDADLVAGGLTARHDPARATAAPGPFADDAARRPAGGAAGRFADGVVRALEAAGWYPGRAAGRQAVMWAMALAGVRSPDGRRPDVVAPALAVLREFGGLTLPADGPGEQVAPVPFTLDPAPAARAVAVVAELGALLGVRVTPVGVTDGGLGLLAVDERGRVFLLDHTADWYLGAGIEEALGALVLGRLPARLRDDGSWT